MCIYNVYIYSCTVILYTIYYYYYLTITTLDTGVEDCYIIQ